MRPISKFRIGEEVKIVGPKEPYFGKTAFITKITPRGSYFVYAIEGDGVGITAWYDEITLEHV